MERQHSQSAYLLIHNQIRTSVDRHLSFNHLQDRLYDLPMQFANPQPRPWQAIEWQAIHPQQIMGMDVQVFLSILAGAIDTEAPIRQYSQTSRQYLESLHPQMARFVGGTIDAAGVLLEPGLWEKEERQHTPALVKVYAQLTGKRIAATPRTTRPYQTSGNPHLELYRHGLHRIATEYGATCLYLWLMVHTTGALHSVLAELMRDEINHMTKFWGFGIWAFPDSSVTQVGLTMLQTTKGRLTYSHDRSSLMGTLHRMTTVLNWQAWSWTNRATFAFTCLYVLQRLWTWGQRLAPDELQALFGTPNSHEGTTR